jgi:hypothetical protein
MYALATARISVRVPLLKKIRPSPPTLTSYHDVVSPAAQLMPP